MKKVFVSILFAGFLNTAMAGDSASYTCIGSTTIFNQNKKITVNLFEHRNSTGDGRETELTLIYGQYVLKGTFNNSDGSEGAVVLKDSKNNYKGNYSMSWSDSQVTLDGKITLSGSVSTLNAVLDCEDLN